MTVRELLPDNDRKSKRNLNPGYCCRDSASSWLGSALAHPRRADHEPASHAIACRSSDLSHLSVLIWIFHLAARSLFTCQSPDTSSCERRARPDLLEEIKRKALQVDSEPDPPTKNRVELPSEVTVANDSLGSLVDDGQIYSPMGIPADNLNGKFCKRQEIQKGSERPWTRLVNSPY
jgi:hypothetical protein